LSIILCNSAKFYIVLIHDHQEMTIKPSSGHYLQQMNSIFS
jgi:hypothetical protein